MAFQVSFMLYEGITNTGFKRCILMYDNLSLDCVDNFSFTYKWSNFNRNKITRNDIRGPTLIRKEDQKEDASIRC